MNLSLERPYKDDNGRPIPTLLDITPDGESVYEPSQDWATKFNERFQRIFVERGPTFFDGPLDLTGSSNGKESSEDPAEDVEDDPVEEELSKYMTPEMLFKMRMEIIPRLHIALGEMSLARDLLSLLLSVSSSSSVIPMSNPTASTLPQGTLAATTVTKPPPILSVQAFDAQLVTGGKDSALRNASDVLKNAAERVERNAMKNEKYWSDALKIRRSNWGLVPAPLPLGTSMGKGSDKASRDFLISFGLEEAPPVFLRRAIGVLADNPLHPSDHSDNEPIHFPQRQKTRLHVSLQRDGKWEHMSPPKRDITSDPLGRAIQEAQSEVVEQEIFSSLIAEAGSLPTATARVSERLIVIEATDGVELQFKLEDTPGPPIREGSTKCDLIYSALHILLLRAHNFSKAARLGLPAHGSTLPRQLVPPRILQPILDFLQYEVFCSKVRGCLGLMAGALTAVGVAAKLRFNLVGESGLQLLRLFVDEAHAKASGEAILRIEDHQSIRFTFSSPSSLMIHVTQANIAVTSIPQLRQLLVDEVGRGLLNRICGIGTDICESFNGIWFVDEMMCRSVGRWEGCVVNFLITCGDDFSVDSTASRISSQNGASQSFTSTYSSRADKSVGLFDWVKDIIQQSVGT